jgi:hypothetical protein
LGAASVRYAQGVIWTMFEWLRSVGYLAGNPIIMDRRRLRSRSAARLGFPMTRSGRQSSPLS